VQLENQNRSIDNPTSYLWLVIVRKLLLLYDPNIVEVLILNFMSF